MDSDDNLVQFNRAKKTKFVELVTFQRRELDQILHLYSMKVGQGEWRDYSIDYLKEKAVFAVYRRSSEIPLYRIEKEPKLTKKQGAFRVSTSSGQILKRGHELKSVLKILEKTSKLLKV